MRLWIIVADYQKAKVVIVWESKLHGGGEVRGLGIVVTKAIVALFLMVMGLLPPENRETSDVP
jgi:hypothetical protein